MQVKMGKPMMEEPAAGGSLYHNHVKGRNLKQRPRLLCSTWLGKDLSVRLSLMFRLRDEMRDYVEWASIRRP